MEGNIATRAHVKPRKEMFNPTSSTTSPMTGREGDPYYHELSNTRTTHVRYKDGKQETLEDDRERTREPLADFWTGETKFEIEKRDYHSQTTLRCNAVNHLSDGNNRDLRQHRQRERERFRLLGIISRHLDSTSLSTTPSFVRPSRRTRRTGSSQPLRQKLRVASKMAEVRHYRIPRAILKCRKSTSR